MTGHPDQAPDCEVGDAFFREISRLIHQAAIHSSFSAACYDGPGRRFEVKDIKICQTTKENVFRASYVVLEYAEGDTRTCGLVEQETDREIVLPDLCSGQPKVEHETSEFLFVKTKSEAGLYYVLDIPQDIRGLGFTPLTQEHNGDCHGKSGPFVPEKIPMGDD